MSTEQGKQEYKEIELFSNTILNRLAIARMDNLLVRPLRTGDYDRGFPQLLSQLTDVGNITRDQFLNRFYQMKRAGDYYVVVIEDVHVGKVIACATLLTEQKFIHNCALRGRLEDVVVNNTYRGKHLGKFIVKVIIQLACHFHCYKLSLDCQDKLLPFYESLGFKREPNNANYLNSRFPSEVAAEQSHF